MKMARATIGNAPASYMRKPGASAGLLMFDCFILVDLLFPWKEWIGRFIKSA